MIERLAGEKKRTVFRCSVCLKQLSVPDAASEAAIIRALSAFSFKHKGCRKVTL